MYVGGLLELAPSAGRLHSLESSDLQDRTSSNVIQRFEEEALSILL